MYVRSLHFTSNEIQKFNIKYGYWYACHLAMWPREILFKTPSVFMPLNVVAMWPYGHPRKKQQCTRVSRNIYIYIYVCIFKLISINDERTNAAGS